MAIVQFSDGTRIDLSEGVNRKHFSTAPSRKSGWNRQAAKRVGGSTSVVGAIYHGYDCEAPVGSETNYDLLCVVVNDAEHVYTQSPDMHFDKHTTDLGGRGL